MGGAEIRSTGCGATDEHVMGHQGGVDADRDRTTLDLQRGSLFTSSGRRSRPAKLSPAVAALVVAGRALGAALPPTVPRQRPP